ncbi:MAG: hypothetical protein CMJ94_02940 [Planctomycetes bacterium]|nr:hypothetical protein [Planctomycetota bacterium]
MNIFKAANYFHEACSWADDKYGLVSASRERYKVAFLLSASLSILLTLALIIMMPLKSVQTLVVHHYDNGITTVDSEKVDASPKNRAQVESDIVRYIQNREAFDISSYKPQFELVRLLSDNAVANQYTQEQSTHNASSPVRKLGNKITRRVHVYSINFLDDELDNQKERKGKQDHANLAEVVFSLKDTDKQSLREQSQQYTALISWRYIAPSKLLSERWQNFAGFEVVRYTRAERNA